MSDPTPPPDVLCRCAKCCCGPGRGHNHPDFPAWAAEAERRDQAMLERYRALLANPPAPELFTAPAPGSERCSTYDGTHSTPHRGCILR